MAEENSKKQVNVSFEKDPELLEALDAMVESDFSDRSKFIRQLISQEMQRRQGALVPAKVTDMTRISKPAIKKSSASKSMNKVLSA